MDWSRLRRQIDEAWRSSGLTLSAVVAKAGFARSTVDHWKNPSSRNLPELENLATYAAATEAQLIVELVPKGQSRTLLAVDADMAEAAALIETLPSNPLDIGEADRTKVLRLLRVAHELEPKDWRGIMNLVEAAEEDVARREVSDDRTARRR